MQAPVRPRKFLAPLLAGAAALCLAGAVHAQLKPKVLESGVKDPTSAIYIGNSFFYYNNSLHGHVTQLVKAADPKQVWRTVSVTISGSGSDWHDVDSYFRPNALSLYSFDANNKVVFNKYGLAINLAETRMGRIVGVSSAGAVGPMQFLPATWESCCVGDPTDAHDAILGAATYLAANDARKSLC